jgi:2-haloalkanoic acid dehalogenase type II
MIKALIFDCYGTLISTGNGSIEASRKILNNLNSNIDPASFYTTWKITHKENTLKSKHFCIEKRIFTNDLKILFEKYSINGDHKKYIKLMLDSLYNRKFYEDVVINLKQLKNNYAIFIASNSDTKPLLQNIGNEKYLFNGIYTSEKLKAYKPSKMFFEKLLKKVRYGVDEILFIGDSMDDDIIGSNAFGIKNVLINRKKINIVNSIANYIITDLYELNGILENDR